MNILNIIYRYTCISIYMSIYLYIVFVFESGAGWEDKKRVGRTKKYECNRLWALTSLRLKIFRYCHSFRESMALLCPCVFVIFISWLARTALHRVRGFQDIEPRRKLKKWNEKDWVPENFGSISIFSSFKCAEWIFVIVCEYSSRVYRPRDNGSQMKQRTWKQNQSCVYTLVIFSKIEISRISSSFFYTHIIWFTFSNPMLVRLVLHNLTPDRKYCFHFFSARKRSPK